MHIPPLSLIISSFTETCVAVVSLDSFTLNFKNSLTRLITPMECSIKYLLPSPFPCSAAFYLCHQYSVFSYVCFYNILHHGPHTDNYTVFGYD